MDPSIAIAAIFYRIVTVLSGFAFAYLGFRLFCLGISSKAGELKATFGENGLILRQVAPGIYFALFGTVIVGISIYRGVDISTEASGVGVTTSESASEEKNVKKKGEGAGNVGQLLGIDPGIDLDYQPQRMLDIVEKMQIDGEDSLDNQEKRLLEIWIGKLKARVIAAQGGVES